MRTVALVEKNPRGRVEVSLQDPLALALRPSRAVIERIERFEQQSALAYHVVRNMPFGSDALSKAHHTGG
jgi:hypothetical protein